LRAPQADGNIVGVKNALRLPALFLLFCILLGLLLTGFSLLELRVGHSGEPPQAARALVASRLVPVLVERFPAAVLFALVLTLFPLYRRPGNRILSYLLPMAAAFAVLAFGGQALRRLPGAPRAPAPTAEGYFLPRSFQEFGGAALYVEAVQGSRLDGVVAMGPPAEGPRLAYLGTSEARIPGQPGGQLAVRGGGRSLSAPARPAYAVLLAEADDPVQRLQDGFAADLRRLSRELDARYRASRSAYYLTCLALVFSFFTAGVFFRITRWPLGNVLLAFLVMRGYLFLFGWLREEAAGELARLAGLPRLVSSLPEAALLALGVVLLLVDLLFLRFERPYGEPSGA
jgi:hypothetical protein